MIEMAAIAVAFLNQVCEISDVIDVETGSRFGEQVVVITVPTNAEYVRVAALLPTDGHEYTMHIMPMFGLGYFTGNSTETKNVLSLAHVEPYNIYGSPENKKLDELLKEVEEREAEAWSSMTQDEKQVAIGSEIDRQRSSGRAEFGNCRPP